MRRRVAAPWLLLVMSLMSGCSAPRPVPTPAPPPRKPGPTMTYPLTHTVDQVDTLFGQPVPDPYRWLEDARSDEVKGWMSQQNELARDYLQRLPGRDALQRRMHDLFYLDSVSAPLRRGGRYFYSRTHKGREKAVAYYRDGESGAEKVLLDPNDMSEDGSISLGVWVPSHDGKHVAYALRRNNADEATLYLLTVSTGAVSDIDVIEGARYANPSWTPSGDGFFYTSLPSEPGVSVVDRPGTAEVRFHRLGQDPKRDPLVHPRTGNPQTFLHADVSRDGHWLLLFISHGWSSTEVLYRDLRGAGDPTGKGRPWQRLATDPDSLYDVTAWKDQLYLRTNHGAPRFRVLKVDPRQPDPDAWREIVPQADGAILEELHVLGGHLVLNYLRHASSAIEVRSLDGSPQRHIPLPGVGAASLTGNPEDNTAYVSYTSLTVPHEIYKVPVRGGSAELWDRVQVPVDPSPYTVEQVFYPSRDGTPVSMFLVHRKDLVRDGRTPFLLTGYGGFNVPMQPSFRGSIYPWLEAGGGYALTNLRGGSEYGEDWHRAGMGPRKQNVFDDFVAAAEHLIKHGYTRPARLGISGGSNGGLLVGAALTQRPELFGAVLCAVPLLDMLRYHRFGSGKTWIPEYGSADDEAGFRVLSAYSPYHRVRGGTDYPAVLFLSADSDDRVDPLHARKMAAMLQAHSTGPGPILLRIEKNAGHGGADMLKQAVEQSTDAFAFLMKQLGVSPAPQ